MSAGLFLAWKYFKPKRSAVSIITLISVVGVALGVCVLMVVLAVMTGFTDKMKEKLLDTASHAQVYSIDRTVIADAFPVLEAAKKAGGEALPVLVNPVLLQKDSAFLPKQLVAFDPDQAAAKRFNIHETLNTKNTSDEKFVLENGEILVGYITARDLGLRVGDKIILHAPNRLASMVKKGRDGKGFKLDAAYLPGEYTIAGTFSFGKYDFDRSVVFLNLDDADTLFGYPLGSSTCVYLWAKDPYNMDGFLRFMRKELPLFDVYSWKDLNSRLLGVLAVEKNMQFFLLAFIVLVAAFSITNTLITTVIQKTREIGILKAVGASSGTVMRIFILQGFFVGFIGTIAGIILGYIVVANRMAILKFLRVVTGQEIFPAEIYVFSELPAHIVPADVLVTAVIAIALCTLGGVIPAFRAAKMDPASALRSE